MGMFKWIIGILLLLFVTFSGAILKNQFDIKDSVSDIKMTTAVHAEKMRHIEKIINGGGILK